MRSSNAWLAAAVVLLAFLSAGGTGCGDRGEAGGRVVVIGLDGATWDLLQPWIDAGDLPILAEIQRTSAWGELRSIVPYLSPPAWASAVTGVNPGKHAIFDFQRRVPGQTAIVNETAKSRRAQPIWNMLKSSGKRVLLLNIPMTDPPDPVDGLFVAGFPHPDMSGFTYPPELEEKLGDYELDRLEMKIEQGQEDSLLQAYTRILETRRRIVLGWLSDEPFDLLWAVFTGTDRIQHLFWKFSDPQNPYYDPEVAARYGSAMHDFWVVQDRALGEILDAAGPDATVLVLSDHGFGPLRFTFRLHGYLRRPESSLSEREANAVQVLDPNDASRLYVMQRGRDPGATYSPNEARRIRGKLIAELRQAVDPATGEKIFEEIWENEGVFTGTYAEKGPDVVGLAADGYMPTLRELPAREDGASEAALPGRPFIGRQGPQLSGWHRMSGLYGLRGPGIQPGRCDGVEGRDYSVLDIVPTVLYLLGEPIPEGLDGDLMRSAIAPDRLADRPAEMGPALEEDYRQMTPEELRNLKNLPYIGG